MYYDLVVYNALGKMMEEEVATLNTDFTTNKNKRMKKRRKTVVQV